MFEEEDESLVDAALAGDVFTFIRNCIIANEDFHQEVCALYIIFTETFSRLYCLVTEAQRCEQLAQGCYAAFFLAENRTHNLMIASLMLYH